MDPSMNRPLRDALALAFASTSFPLVSTCSDFYFASSSPARRPNLVIAVYGVAKGLQFLFPMAYVGSLVA